MELKKITIDGYKNVVDTTIDFYDITSILSLNNYGKSNLLSAIVFGLSFMQNPTKIKQQMMNDIKCIPLLKVGSDSFSFKIEVDTQINNNMYSVEYMYSFRWGVPNKYFGEILSECLKIKSEGGFNRYIIRENGEAYYRTSLSGRCSKKIAIDKNELVLCKIKAYDDLFYLEIVKQLLENLNAYVDRHFDSSSGYSLTFMSEKELEDLTLKPALNIPKTLYNINKKNHDKFELIKNVFISMFPSIQDIIVKENRMNIGPQLKMETEDGLVLFSEKTYSLYQKNKNLKSIINFSALSDGAKRILLLLTFIVVANINGYSLICIEEPENSIHPKLLRSFLYSISELAGHTKLLFTSHSPYLINYMDPWKIYLGMPNDIGMAQFKKIKDGTNATKRLLNDVENNNMLLGEYLFDLMSGSEDDLEDLISYVE